MSYNIETQNPRSIPDANKRITLAISWRAYNMVLMTHIKNTCILWFHRSNLTSLREDKNPNSHFLLLLLTYNSNRHNQHMHFNIRLVTSALRQTSNSLFKDPNIGTIQHERELVSAMIRTLFAHNVKGGKWYCTKCYGENIFPFSFHLCWLQTLGKCALCLWSSRDFKPTEERDPCG